MNAQLLEEELRIWQKDKKEERIFWLGMFYTTHIPRISKILKNTG
jgi:hypothetical protein